MSNNLMKDSGVEWIGEIPEDWKAIRVKDKYIFDTGFTPETKHSEFYSDENGFEWVTISDLNNGKVDSPTKSLISRDYVRLTNRIQAPAGCLLYSFKLSVGQIAKTDRPLFTNEALACFFPTKAVNIDFLKYSCALIEHSANTNIYGAKILNQQTINNAHVVFPPLEVQQKIVDFLDRKCAEIDELVVDIQEQIAVLVQYKKSVITEAVTKGLNPKVPMKDSGIEWLGVVPEHWDIKPLKYIFMIISGSTPNSADPELWDGDIIWITPADFKTRDYHVHSGHRNITERGFKSCSTHFVPANSLIFSKRAPIGSVVINNVPLCINQGCLACVPQSTLDIKFYYYLMSIYEDVFHLFGSGTTFKEISATVFGNIRFAVPSIDEQHCIVCYLVPKCSEIDAVIDEKKVQLEALAEYKKSLIYEYVTGKKEVHV